MRCAVETEDLALRRLESVLQECAPLAVALSGGVDSTLLYHEARRLLGDRARAVIGVSASLAEGDLELARSVAQQIGGDLLELTTSELSHSSYRANQGRRCYYCKRELYTRIAAHPRLAGWTICDGSNADDPVSDRPGMEAAAELGVRSPLREAGWGKQAIRTLARRRSLPNWDRPARPCLASRIPVGTEVREELLARVERLEAVLAAAGFRAHRARVDAEDAIVEFDAEELGRAGEEAWRRDLLAEADRLGVRRVLLDLRGYCGAPGGTGEIRP